MNAAMKRSVMLLAVLTAAGFFLCGNAPANEAAPSTAGQDLQRLVDGGAGGLITLRSAEYHLDKPLVIEGDGTILRGPAKIIQHNPGAPILHVRGASKVVISGVALTRAAAVQETHQAGLLATDCDWLRLEHLRVEENHSDSAAIRMMGCRFTRVADCDVLNYKRIAVDDRTQTPDAGYAFRCIGGLGIELRGGRGNSIINNRIVEARLLPTPEAMERHSLGSLTKRSSAGPGSEQQSEVHRLQFARNWHQGSAIMVSRPLPPGGPGQEPTRLNLIRGNYIENAAQGIDLHCDNFVCTENSIHKAMIGVKVMHGSRHGVVCSNIIDKADLWGIMLGPGSLSHYAQPASDAQAALPANHDGAIVVSGNVISNFGFGNDYWNWADSPGGPSGYAIRVDYSPSAATPPISEVVIEGNIVTDAGSQGVIEEGLVTHPTPRYRYALWVESSDREEARSRAPENITTSGNHFDAGTNGKANVSLQAD